MAEYRIVTSTDNFIYYRDIPSDGSIIEIEYLGGLLSKSDPTKVKGNTTTTRYVTTSLSHAKDDDDNIWLSLDWAGGVVIDPEGWGRKLGKLTVAANTSTNDRRTNFFMNFKNADGTVNVSTVGIAIMLKGKTTTPVTPTPSGITLYNPSSRSIELDPNYVILYGACTPSVYIDGITDDWWYVTCTTTAGSYIPAGGTLLVNFPNASKYIFAGEGNDLIIYANELYSNEPPFYSMIDGYASIYFNTSHVIADSIYSETEDINNVCFVTSVIKDNANNLHITDGQHFVLGSSYKPFNNANNYILTGNTVTSKVIYPGWGWYHDYRYMHLIYDTTAENLFDHGIEYMEDYDIYVVYIYDTAVTGDSSKTIYSYIIYAPESTGSNTYINDYDKVSSIDFDIIVRTLIKGLDNKLSINDVNATAIWFGNNVLDIPKITANVYNLTRTYLIGVHRTNEYAAYQYTLLKTNGIYVDISDSLTLTNKPAASINVTELYTLFMSTENDITTIYKDKKSDNNELILDYYLKYDTTMIDWNTFG